MLLARILGTLYPTKMNGMYVKFNNKSHFIHTDPQNNHKYIELNDGSKLTITEFETL